MFLPHRDYYQSHYQENIMDRIRTEIGGSLEPLVIRLFQGPRGRSDNTPLNADMVADQLYQAGKAKMFGTNNQMFVNMICSHTAAEMSTICDVYDMKYGHSLESAIKSEYSGVAEKAYVCLLRDPVDLYCIHLKEATCGFGTKEEVVSRIIGGSDKALVKKIADRYVKMFNTSLISVLTSELSGYYRQACITYVDTSGLPGQGATSMNKLAQIAIESKNPMRPSSHATRHKP